jgi:antitoxin (DNA-binding transcriptional repressor) of toxin-antitoxin stability system
MLSVRPPELRAWLMATVKLQDAESQLAALIDRAEAGEEIVIARGDKPVAKLVAVQKQHPRLAAGMWKGKFDVPDSFFFDPLPEDELKLWEGDDEDPARSSRAGLVPGRLKPAFAKRPRGD